MMGSHPANDRLHILNLCRPRRLAHDAVLPRHKKIAMLGHAQTKALFEGRAVGSSPPTPRQE
jgi:hypothetical protein